MSGARIEIKVDDAEVKAALRELAKLGDDMTPVMRSIGEQLRLHVDERFEGGFGPGKVPWVKSGRAKRELGQTLVSSNLLMESMTKREPIVTPTSVTVGTSTPYAATHQFGATIRAKTAKGLVFKRPGGGWVRVKQVTIPARPFLGFDDQDRREVDAIIRDHIAKVTRGGAGGATA
jgi:phage virion morphogenesis protein